MACCSLIGYVAYGRLRALLSVVDEQLEIALAILLTGLLFVLSSVIVERVQDARVEREAAE